jgi:hypothetical protein
LAAAKQQAKTTFRVSNAYCRDGSIDQRVGTCDKRLFDQSDVVVIENPEAVMFVRGISQRWRS